MKKTLLQHGVSSPRGGCKHGTRAPFQGSPLKGQRLRRDRGSAAAFITSGARRARRRAGFLRRPRGRRLPSCGVLAGPSLCGCVAQRTALPRRRRPGSPGPQARPERPLPECPKATRLHLRAFQGADTSCPRSLLWKMDDANFLQNGCLVFVFLILKICAWPCKYVHHVYAMHAAAGRGRHSPLELELIAGRATPWLLGTEIRSSKELQVPLGHPSSP